MKKGLIYVTIILSVCLFFSFSVYADTPNDIRDNSGYQTSDSREEVQVEILRISASDTSGLHSVVLSLIGDYNPIVKDYTYITTSYNGSQQTNHVVEITPDYSWLMTCALFIVIVYCFFRFLGSLVYGGKL